MTLLQRAAPRPVHAYLLSGPAGSGVHDAARSFAAALLCPDGGCGTCHVCTRVLRTRHPDVIEVEPDGTFVVVEQIADVIDEAYASPFEANRKVIVLFEADRMNEPAANKLLKTLEEPPPRTHFVLVATAADELLETVRSRCQRIDFATLGEPVIHDALVADGVAEEQARLAARLSGGRLDRARLLTGPWAPLRAAVIDVVLRLDGNGAAVAIGAADLDRAADAALTALESELKVEADVLDSEIEQASYPDRAAQALRRRLAQRHKRALRRARTDALTEIVTAIESIYRDSLAAGGRPINLDTEIPAVDPAAASDAIDACRLALTVLADRTVVNEQLLLERLLIHLPPLPILDRQR